MPTRSLAALAALVAGSSIASTIIPHTLAQRAEDADRVAIARVVGHVVTGDGARLKTLTRLEVEQDVKGTGPRVVTVVQIGGRQGPVEVSIPGDARFTMGERVLVFLRCHRVDRCALVALGEGRLPIVEGKVVYRDLFTGVMAARPLPELIRELSATPARRGSSHL